MFDIEEARNHNLAIVPRYFHDRGHVAVMRPRWRLCLRLAQIKGERLEDPGDGRRLLLLRDEQDVLLNLLSIAHEADGRILEAEERPGLGLEVDAVEAGQRDVLSAKFEHAFAKKKCANLIREFHL